jgi:hypothetical protein
LIAAAPDGAVQFHRDSVVWVFYRWDVQHRHDNRPEKDEDSTQGQGAPSDARFAAAKFFHARVRFHSILDFASASMAFTNGTVADRGRPKCRPWLAH